MTTGRINQVAIVSAPRERDTAPPPLYEQQRPMVALQSLQLRSCFLPSSAHTRAQSVRACVRPHTGYRRRHRPSPSYRQTNVGANPPPSFDSFVNIPPRQHPSNKDNPVRVRHTHIPRRALSDTSAVRVRHQRHAPTPRLPPPYRHRDRQRNTPPSPSAFAVTFLPSCVILRTSHVLAQHFHRAGNQNFLKPQPDPPSVHVHVHARTGARATPTGRFTTTQSDQPSALADGPVRTTPTTKKKTTTVLFFLSTPCPPIPAKHRFLVIRTHTDNRQVFQHDWHVFNST